MNTSELAELTDVSPRTIRRYAKSMILNPSRSLTGSYNFTPDDIDKTLLTWGRNLRRLALASPGLARHLESRRKRRLGGLRTMDKPRANIDRGPIQPGSMPKVRI